MSPVPPLFPLGSLFLLSGVGAALEITFRKFTGRRVRGWAGRVWMYGWMLMTSRSALAAWLDAGVGGCWLTRRQGLEGLRPGEWVGKGIVRWLFGVRGG